MALPGRYDMSKSSRAGTLVLYWKANLYMHESNTLQGFQGMLQRLASITKKLLIIFLLYRRKLKTKQKGYQKWYSVVDSVRPPIAYRHIRINAHVHRWVIIAGSVKIQVKQRRHRPCVNDG